MAAYPLEEWDFQDLDAEFSDFDARVEESVNQPCTYLSWFMVNTPCTTEALEIKGTVYAHEDSSLVCMPWCMRAHTPHVSVWLSQHTIHHGMHTNAL